MDTAVAPQLQTGIDKPYINEVTLNDPKNAAILLSFDILL